MIADVMGYSFARVVGNRVLCAAGRSPVSLGIVLGLAAGGTTWARAHSNHTPGNG